MEENKKKGVLQKIKSFAVKRKKLFAILVIVGILIVGGIIYGAVSGGAEYEYTTTMAEKGSLTQTVDATGSVESAKEIDLNFKKTGKLYTLHVEVGDQVEEGRLLAELDAKDEILALEKARANLASAHAELNLKIVGESRESIQVSEEEVRKAQANLENAQTDLENTIANNQETIRQKELDVSKYSSAYKNAKNGAELDIDNAYNDVRITLFGNLLAANEAIQEADNILGIDNTLINDDFEDYLGVIDKQHLTDAQDLYELAGEEQEESSSLINNLSSQSSYVEIESAMADMEDFLLLVDSLLYKVKLTLDNTTTGTGLSLTELNTKKSTINTERTTINTEQTSLETDKQAINSAKVDAESSVDTAQDNLKAAEAALEKAKVDADSSYKSAVSQVNIAEAALESAKASLALKKAAPRRVDLASLEARVEEARANLELAEQDLENTRIKSPIAGIVTKINYEIGEHTSLNEPVMVVLGGDLLRIEVDISESDIPKVKKGDSVAITFDAFGEDREFKGTVNSIEPAETLIQDVVYYQVKIDIDNPSEDIKPGMTANVDILTATRDDVVYMPQRAVVRRNGEQIVRILENGEEKEVPVELGLYADEGLVEVKSGVNPGDEVITFKKEKQ